MTFAAPHAAATTPPPPLHSDHARQQLHRITAALPAEQRAEIRAKIRALAADAYQTGYVAGYEDGRDDGLPPIPTGPTPRAFHGGQVTCGQAPVLINNAVGDEATDPVALADAIEAAAVSHLADTPHPSI